MPAKPPILDNRALQDILKQLRDLANINLHDVWTPPLEGDAGTMLQRIFARLMELAIQRLNQVPEKNLLAFLDTMGVSLLPPSPAKVPLTFTLTTGSPPTLVPKGTQAGTQPSGQQPAVIFETEDDLTVIPAQITQGFTMDPTWDRYTDQTTVLGGQSPIGFTPFVGAKRMPHVLYLGDDTLLNFNRASGVALILRWQSASSPVEIERLFRGLVYQYQTQGRLKTITPLLLLSPQNEESNQTVLPFIIPDLIDQETIQGVGLPQGIQSRWLRAILTMPFLDALVAQDLQLTNIVLKVSDADLLPDLAFTNAAPVDVTTDFTPLGGKPKAGDAFYFANDEVFNKEGASVTLSLEIREIRPPELVWEYFGPQTAHAGGWIPVPSVTDGTGNFQNPGQIVLDGIGVMALANITTATGLPSGDSTEFSWVRTRLVNGGWSGAPNIAQLSVTGTNIIKLSIGFANDKRINDFTGQFAPFGDRPGVQSIFYLGFGQLIPIIGDIDQRQGLTITLKIDSATIAPLVATLAWEYLSDRGWQTLSVIADSSVKLLIRSGTITFTNPAVVRAQVNGQMNRWLRVRLDSGDFGVEAEFIPVDPNDPSKGFKQRPGTGVLVAPVIKSFKMSYTAMKRPTIVRRTGFVYQQLTQPNQQQSQFAPFTSISDPTLAPYDDYTPAFYLGFDAAFPEEPVRVYFDITPRAFAGSVVKEARAAPVPPSALPPLQWEYYDGTAWRKLTVFDDTNNLTESGTVEFLTPTDMATLTRFDLAERYWIRARSAQNDPLDTQQLQGVFLNTIPATQAVTVQNEILGSSNGQPSQTVNFARPPVLSGQQVIVIEPESPSDQERAAIEAEEGPDAVQEIINPTTGGTEILVRWHEVPNFVVSNSHSRHYTLDHTSGLLIFSDGKRGLIPPPGTNNIMANYRSGGGTAGNVPKGAVAQVKTPLPGVGGVTNPVRADGGAEVETIPMVEERGPQTLRHRDRAVACSDLEYLARQAAGTRVARTQCLSNVNRELRFEPGWVTVLIVPQGSEPKLSPGSELIREVENYLEARAFVGLTQQIPARVNVIGPGYIQVAVVAEVVAQDIDEAELVKKRIRDTLDAFFHPLTGGPNGTGWEFGRDVYVSEVAQIIEGVSGVDHVKSLQLRPNIAQHRLTFTSAPPVGMHLSIGDTVMMMDRSKAAILAELVSTDGTVVSIAVKGFKEGDRITKVLDLTDPHRSGKTVVDGISRPVITVDSFNSDAVGFPRCSVVTTFDGAMLTRLAVGIPPNESKLTQIVIEDDDFAFQTDDVLTIYYPFQMTITSVTLETQASVQTLDIQPYESEVAFATGTILATLDNRVRLPLLTGTQTDTGVTTITSIRLLDFKSDDIITEFRRDNLAHVQSLTIQYVEPVGDIVYLDDNFLVYSGKHSITMVAE